MGSKITTVTRGTNQGLVTVSPVEGGLRQVVHPGLQLQAGELRERWDDEGEDQSEAHKDGR